MSNDLLSRLQAAKTDEEREWIVFEFSLQNLEKDVQDAVWAAAIPHWFDEAFLAALLGKTVKQASAIYKRIQELSFIEVFPSRGQNVHDRTRKLLLRHLWAADREKYEKISLKAAGYCSGQNQEDVSWRVEWIYHLLIGDPDKAAIEIQNVGWDWNNAPKFAYENVEVMVRAAREHAAAERLTPRCFGWVKFFDALVDLDYYRYIPAKTKLEGLQEFDISDKYLLVEVNFRLGKTYYMFAEYEKARNSLNRALPICRETGYRQGEANCIHALGQVDLKAFDLENAQKHLDDAVKIYKDLGDRLGEANSYYDLGDLYRAKDEFDTSRRNYELSLEIGGEINSTQTKGNALMMIGFVDKLTRNYDSAVEYFQKAIHLHREAGNKIGEMGCLLYLGDIDQARAQREDAKNKFTTALQFYERENMRYDVGISLWRLGDVARDGGDKDSARKHYHRAYEIFKETGSTKYAQSVKQALDSL